jgi:cytochrome c biogenesis protein CcdA
MTALALAFSAGMVATFNPCGFAMLPAYLSSYMGLHEEDGSRRWAVRSALVVGAVVSIGFLVVFGAAGVVIAGVSRSLATEWIPRLALVVGVAVAVLGVALLAGYEPVFGFPRAKRAGGGRGHGKVLGFGVSYAVASLSCTLPVFLTVVAAQITRSSFAAGLLVFVAYAAGMATVLIGITVVLALGKQSLLSRLRRSVRHVNRVSGVVLVAAGGWIVWFWATALASGAGALGGAGSFRFVEDLSQRLLNFVADNTLVVAVMSAILLATAAVYALRGREPDHDHDPRPEGIEGDVETVGVTGGGSDSR